MGSTLGVPINHLSVFALAPIPALIYLGKKLGDIRSADVYQRHRNPPGWEWRELADQDFQYTVSSSAAIISGPTTKVAVKLSLSGSVHDGEIKGILGSDVSIYGLSVNKPQRDYLQSREQLELFCNEWYRLMSQIRLDHGAISELHIFAAVPNSVAVEIGRSTLKADPPFVLYDYADGIFTRAFII